ncbi:DUF4293 domain-containing protein [Prevotella sp. KH2C16]|uniref:DUF4293 domain-containing protein n=1 Tax=Prevotella sp. KH2C16 TaxID=1855325 RepID=UPI0008EFD9F9|nr:DUF4293 domain-containing protein [Prevotella sp. KH2C16]SFF94254.1 protein of unknown function [Prevotella sp. KH2C16]
MIQRVQTVYLLLALLATIICLCLPIGSIAPKGMGVEVEVFNLFVTAGQGTVSFSVWPLFALLLITCPLAIAAIMAYKKRRLQAKLCYWNIVFCLAWYVYYAFMVLNNFQQMGTYHPAFAVCLPFVAMALYAFAHRGIMKDEELIKSSERIR